MESTPSRRSALLRCHEPRCSACRSVFARVAYRRFGDTTSARSAARYGRPSLTEIAELSAANSRGSSRPCSRTVGPKRRLVRGRRSFSMLLDDRSRHITRSGRCRWPGRMCQRNPGWHRDWHPDRERWPRSWYAETPVRDDQAGQRRVRTADHRHPSALTGGTKSVSCPAGIGSVVYRLTWPETPPSAAAGRSTSPGSRRPKLTAGGQFHESATDAGAYRDRLAPTTGERFSSRRNLKRSCAAAAPARRLPQPRSAKPGECLRPRDQGAR